MAKKSRAGGQKTKIAQQFDEWLRERRDLLPRSRSSYDYDCRFMFEFFERHNVTTAAAVNKTIAEAYATALEKSGRRKKIRGKAAGLSKATQKLRLAVASAFFEDLAAAELIAKNPFATVRAPKLPKRVITCPTFDEAQALIDAIPDTTFLDARLRLLLGFALHTGARISEILGSNWGAFDHALADHGVVTLRGKGDKERVVPLSAWLASELRAFQQNWATGGKGIKNAPVFVGRKGKRLRAKAVYASIERHQLRSKHGVHPHLFRHVFGTTLANQGARVHVIADLMGHESWATALQYIHSTGAQSREAIRLLDWLMAYLPANRPGAPTTSQPAPSQPAQPVVTYGLAQGVANGVTYMVVPVARPVALRRAA